METKKIQKIYHDLAKNGFTCEPIENGIRVKRKIPGMTDATMDVSILESKKDIKNKSKTNASDIEKDTNAPCIYHFGCRGKNHLYVAQIYGSKLTEAQEHYLNIRKTMELLHGVDLKMFRQGMDQINLSRSGIIRSSLTRIYRAAENLDTMTNTLSDETGRIVKANKQETIKHLTSKSKDPFVKKVICLLWDAIALQTA